VAGPAFRQRAAFKDALRHMRNRVAAFVNLPLTSIDRMTLTSRLQGIGAMDGAAIRAPQMA
jgi:arsenate reductase